MKKLIQTRLFYILVALFGLIGNAQIRSTGEVILRDDNVATLTVQLDLDIDNSMVIMRLVGPENRWFGVSFDVDVSQMLPDKDCVYISEGELVDSEIVGFDPPVVDANNNWTVTSNSISNGQRTVVASRALDTGDPTDYVFEENLTGLGMIFAHGRNAGDTEIARHGGANAGVVTASFETLSVKELDASVLTMYPNPVKNKLQIEIKDGNNPKLTVMDYLGKTVKIQPLKVVANTYQLEVSDLAKGMYLLKLETKNGQLTKKFMKY
ncbi:T9SS type A sorting domain-containing protein [Aquimarina sp. ERC-38]|uniref:T9SS type A sorting domain-containing protein n=1 Tax=Aquimarina sp. ERC-38 TaxID=2949996 RepID=UPI00224516F8|nr:T9SS type A sorting domain-containing protein [Aquimarina sp. ERC-38]UZO80786.1 T9SS type A sorting domain-containing protein [Aquimarina sp. ERC-38]